MFVFLSVWGKAFIQTPVGASAYAAANPFANVGYKSATWEHSRLKKETRSEKSEQKVKKKPRVSRKTRPNKIDSWTIVYIVWGLILLGLLGFGIGIFAGVLWLWVAGLGAFGLIFLINVLGVLFWQEFMEIATIVCSIMGYALFGLLSLIAGAVLSIGWALWVGIGLLSFFGLLAFWLLWQLANYSK